MKAIKLLVLPFLLCLMCFFPVGCETAEKASEGLKYMENVSGKSYSVQSVGTCTDKKIVIPKKYNGKPVTRIHVNAFLGVETLEQIVLPEGLQYIDKNAFDACVNLKAVTIPNTVVEIGSSAFSGCSSLASVTFGWGSQLERIDSAAFTSCTSLLKFEVPSKVKTVGNYAFQDCTSLVETTFREGATYDDSGYALWRNCTSLKVAHLPGSFDKLAWAIFENCTSLETVFVGTQEEFERLDKEYARPSNGPFWQATHYFYSEEPPRESGNFWHYVEGKMAIWE